MTTETAEVARLQESSMTEELQVLAQAMEQVIQNVTTQTQVNDAIVGRLLMLERRVMEMVEKGAGAKRSATTSSEGSCASPAAKIAGETNASLAVPFFAMARQDGLPLYLGESTGLCRVMKSFLMYVDTRDTYITPPLMLSGVWEPVKTRFVMQKVKAGMKVVDIGANCGYYTILMAAAVGPTGHVYAFEPHPRNLELIERNLQVNGFDERVKVFPKAALDRKGSVELHQISRNTGAHTLFIVDTEHGAHPKLRVETVALDEVIDDPLDFAKIDAEGSEPLILRGMKKLIARSPQLQILMEFNKSALSNAGIQPEEFLRELKESGYSLSSITPQSTLIPANEARLLREPISTVVLSRNGN